MREIENGVYEEKADLATRVRLTKNLNQKAAMMAEESAVRRAIAQNDFYHRRAMRGDAYYFI